MNTRAIIFYWAVGTVVCWGLLGVAWSLFGPTDDLVMANTVGFKMLVAGIVVSVPSLVVFLLIWALDAYLRKRRSNSAAERDASESALSRASFSAPKPEC